MVFRGALLAVIILAYVNAFGLGFALDGGQLVAGDPRIQAASLSNLKLIFTANYWWSAPDRLYRPLTTLSFLVNYSVLGNRLDPFGYHAINILLHALNAMLVFGLARRALRSDSIAFFAAALWSAHPIGVEAVANIAGRADLLAATGILGGLWFYARPAGWARPVGVFACAVLAVFSKESGAVLIGLMLLWELTPGLRDERRSRARVFDYLAALLALALYLGLRWRAVAAVPEPFLPFIDNPLRGAGFWMARWSALKILALDFGLLVWPARLACDRSYNEIPLASATDVAAWAGLLLALGIVVFAVVRRRRDPVWFWAAGFFGIALLPTSNLAVIIGAPMAERFLYVPSIGFAIAVAALAARLSNPTATRVALAAVVALCAARTLARNPDWNDTLTLAAHDSASAPASWRLLDMHGEFLMQERRDLDGAIREVSKSWSVLEPLPDSLSDPQVPTSLGFYYLIRGDRAGAANGENKQWYSRAEPLLERAARIARVIQSDLDASQLRAGKPFAARRPYQRVFFTLGDAYRAVGRPADALDAFASGRQIAPTADEGYDRAAAAAVEAGRPDVAARLELEKAIVAGSTPNSLRAVAEAYQRVDGGACAVARNGALPVLNVACSRLVEDLCPAVAEIVRTFEEARDPARAASFARMAPVYGCPAPR